MICRFCAIIDQEEIKKNFIFLLDFVSYLTSTSHLCVLTSTCKAIVIFSKNYHPLWLIRSHSSIPLSPYSTSFYHTKYVRFLKIDGFEQDRRVVVIAATNRKEDLDPALIRCSFLLMYLFFYCKQSQIVLAVPVLLQKLPCVFLSPISCYINV